MVLCCASGNRSALVAKSSKEMGTGNVAHVAGGFAARRQAGAPIMDRELLKQALHELVRLKVGAAGQTLVLSHLYASALEEWAERLGVEPRRLDKLVLVQEAMPFRPLH